MLLILLKSTACLAIFIVFYKLLLEREKMHQFKRYYLLTALVVSFAIPFITFTKYVEPTFDTTPFQADYSAPINLLPVNAAVIEAPIDYLPIILWSIYSLGALVFGLKFGLNLFRIVSKINKNEKQKHGNLINVLLQDSVSPHTFFRYIFLNKTKFQTKAIPQEVLLHEATHAKQKHSLDVLFIELLQVLFWFNPLLYYIKKDIKLNHEFLADDAVLKQGIDSSTYQNMLLAFSSNATEPELANAINYSLIKKRFNIMKTQTSKKAMWLRSLLLFPLLGGLLFSFSGTEEVEKGVLPEIKFETPQEFLESERLRKEENNALTDVKNELEKTNALKINYTTKTGNALTKYNEAQDTLLIINGIVCHQCELNLSKKSVEDMRLSTTTGEQILSFKFTFPGKATVTVKGSALNKEAIKLLDGVSLGTVIQLFDIKTQSKQKLPPVKIKLVDQNNRNYSKSPIIKAGEKSSLPPPPPPPAPIKEYDAMKARVKSTLPPPPPPPSKAPQYKHGKKLTLNEIIQKTPKGVESGFEMLKNGESHYYTVHSGRKTYYNKDGYITDKKGAILPPPPPPPPAPKMIKGQASNIPAPPAPPKPISTKKHIENMAAKGADFFYNGESISSKKALKLVKSNSKMNISSHSDNGNSIVHLSTEPITVINGRASINKNRTQATKERMTAHEKRKEIAEEQRKEAMAAHERAMRSHEKAIAERNTAMREQQHMQQRSLSEQLEAMEAQGNAFFYEGEKISKEKAIMLVKENPKLNISMHNNNGKGTVHLSKKGIKTVNGKLVKKE